MVSTCKTQEVLIIKNPGFFIKKPGFVIKYPENFGPISATLIILNVWLSVYKRCVGPPCAAPVAYTRWAVGIYTLLYHGNKQTLIYSYPILETWRQP